MSSRKLLSRSQSVDRAGNVQSNMDEDSSTDLSQESRIMVGEIRDSEVSASNPNLENMNQETPITNPNSNEQSSNISRDQLQEFLSTVMQGMKAGQEEFRKQNAAGQEEFRKQIAAGQEEAKKQNAALQEEFKKQTAAQEESKKQTAQLAAESAKLTSAVESLRSEIKEENDRLAKSLTAKFEAAHDKIRKDFEVKLSSEIVTVSAKIDDVRKDNEGEISKLSSTIDEVYVGVTEKVDTAVTQTKGEMAQYVDDKFRAISGDMRQVRKNADEISKVQATLGELQNKIASVSSNTPQSADSGNAIVRVVTTDQQVAPTSSGVGANILPSTNGVSVSSNVACNDSTSIVSQTRNSGVCTNVNVTSEKRNKSVVLNP